ncbi:MAG TPA: acyl-CoA reductase [Polyangiaceae bacterium]|nr:acyl-CoA reductase [Polyangiaceae bacterium]
MDRDVRARLEELLRGARRLADDADPIGREARARLTRSSGLSRENVEWALREALETSPSDAELEALVESVATTPRSHVLLSANVFVAAHRAIALALAASPEVYVRPSRREPEMTELLAEATPGLFRRVDELTPSAGDQLFAYGRAETLDQVARALPEGVLLSTHGPGFGVVVLSEPLEDDERLATALSVDITAFDQRGCLSPRVALLEAPRERALAFAKLLAASLTARQNEVPLGALGEQERAEIARYRDTLLYTGELYPAGEGYVGVAAPDAPLELAPVGRNLHVLAVDDATALLEPVQHAITTFSHAGPEERRERLAAILPHARAAKLGRMQTPLFDGPVDRRVKAR